jgi:hypothetical protein
MVDCVLVLVADDCDDGADARGSPRVRATSESNQRTKRNSTVTVV